MASSLLQPHSQTFVGVLASLLLITIIWSRESNFVISIIQERSEVIKDIWRSLNSAILKHSKKWKFLKHDPNWMYADLKKAFFQEEDAHSLNIRMDEDASERLILLDEEIETYKQTFVTNYLRQTMPMIEKKIESIKNSRKIIISAIFALMSCLLIFLIDEIMAIFPSKHDFLATFLCLFLIVGSAFWFGMWSSFFFRHLPWINEKDEHIEKSGFFQSGSSLKLIITLAVWGAFWVLLGSIMPNLWVKRVFVILIGMIIPVVYVGSRKIQCWKVKEKMLYSFAINHFLVFCALALIWSVLLFVGDYYLSDFSEVFFSYEDWNSLLIFVEIYLLVIGIISPIFIPYFNTYILQWYMNSRMYQPSWLIKKDKRWAKINKAIEDLYYSVSTQDYWRSYKESLQ